MRLEILRDENGKLSTTRLTVLVTLVVFVIAASADIFGDSVIDPTVYHIFQTVFGVGLGGQALRTSVRNYRQPLLRGRTNDDD